MVIQHRDHHDYDDRDKKKKHGHCDFEITPFKCELWGSIETSVYEKDYPQGEHDSKTIIACDEDWYVKVKWELWGDLLHHLCGYFCICVFMESIGPGPEYKLECKEWIPMDPCTHKDGHYEEVFRIPAGKVDCGDCGQLYEVGVTLTSFDQCKNAGHIAAYCTGPTLMFYKREGEPYPPPPPPPPPPPGPPPPPPPPPPVFREVSIVDNAFNPSNVSISAGQIVRWTHNGALPHTVTSNPGPAGCTPPSVENFASATLNTGNTFLHTFNAPGTFPYHCEIHGCTMAGTVTVT